MYRDTFMPTSDLHTSYINIFLMTKLKQTTPSDGP